MYSREVNNGILDSGWVHQYPSPTARREEPMQCRQPTLFPDAEISTAKERRIGVAILALTTGEDGAAEISACKLLTV